jgi:hypothetical protein
MFTEQEGIMSETGLLDTLVKLASLGTSGICIFVIFWIGWLLSKPAAPRSAQRERTYTVHGNRVVMPGSGGSAIWAMNATRRSLRQDYFPYR